MKRVVVALVFLAACSSKPGLEKTIPHAVQSGYDAACKADTTTLKTAEETTFAATNAYEAQSTPLHKVTTSAGSYAITIADSRCGTIGHTVGQTAADN